MEKRTRIYYFSHLFIIVSGIFYLVDLAIGYKFNSLLSLAPGKYFNNTEWWRLLTYPLALNTIEGIMLFIFVFLLFAPKLEEIYHTLLYPVVLLSVIIFQGLLFTNILWNSNLILSGMDGLTFFVLTLFTLLNLKGRLVVANKLFVHTSLFSLSLITLWFITLFFHSVWVENYQLIFKGLYSATFGCSIGFIAYLHIRFTRKISSKNASSAINTRHAEAIRKQIFSLAMIANEELKRVNEELMRNSEPIEQYPKPDEDRLNDILDKINDLGAESLTEEEKKFLDGYSDNHD